jgi:hypothetical protein
MGGPMLERKVLLVMRATGSCGALESLVNSVPGPAGSARDRTVFEAPTRGFPGYLTSFSISPLIALPQMS